MRSALPKPLQKAMIYEDKNLYACLATHPVAKGHVVVVWKKNVSDLGRLAERDYDRLMDAVNAVRSAMLAALKIKKVYLAYMDEVRHVHWHLIPRYNQKGFNVFLHAPKKTVDFSLAPKIKRRLSFS